ncbi:MAG: hypothetical protein ACOY5F_21960 [Pseudomonadota bacterium]
MTEVIRGRAAIAHRLGRSERTISRWVRDGLLPVVHEGPFDNGILCARASDIERLKLSMQDEVEQ